MYNCESLGLTCNNANKWAESELMQHNSIWFCVDFICSHAILARRMIR